MVKLYYDLLSQPARSVYLFLSKNKLPFQKCPIAIRKGEHKTPEYAKISLFQKVPAIDDNGFKLTESIAIYRYLINSYPDKFSDNWYSKDPKKQCRVDEYLEWQHLNTRYQGSMYFLTKFFTPLMSQTPPNQKNVERFRVSMETVGDNFEEVWLKGDEPYIAGSSLSLADLVAFCELQMPVMAGFDMFKGRPKLAAWYQNVSNELQPELKEITDLLDKIKKQGDAALAKL